MKNIQTLGGVSALLESFIYVLAFIFFGVFYSFPVDVNSVQQFAFLAENKTILSVVNFIMYVLFGIFLVVLVLALYERLKASSPILSQIASVFGIIWVGLVIASGMIANIGLASVLELSVTDPERAMTVWHTINAIVEGLGGGNEVVGGLWVFLISLAALKTDKLSKLLSYFGLFVGSVGILTIYPAQVLTEIFGVSQIVWFNWIGLRLLKNSQSK